MSVAIGLRTPARRRLRASALGLVVLGVAAFALRAGLIAHTPGYHPRHDDRDYARVAWSMAQGHGYPRMRVYLPGGRVRELADAYRPPLWPATLAAVFALAARPAGHLPHAIPGLTAARLLTAALGALGAMLTALLAARIWGRRAGWLAGALAAAYLPLALLSTVLASETLFVVLELAAVLVALDARSTRRALAAGALVGLAWLTRTNGVLMLVPVAALVAAPARGRRAKALRAGAAALACVAVVAPWTVRNAEQLHAFVPVSTEVGPTLAGTYNATSLHDRRDPGAWRLLRETPWRHALAPGTPSAHADARLRALALGFAFDHPGYVFAVAAHNAQRIADLAGRRRWRFEARTIDIGPRAADAGVFCAWAAMALAAAGLALGAWRRVPRGLWLAPALLLASALFVNAETPRFRAPVDPYLLILAGAGLAAMGERLTAASSSPSRTTLPR